MPQTCPPPGIQLEDAFPLKSCTHGGRKVVMITSADKDILAAHPNVQICPVFMLFNDNNGKRYPNKEHMIKQPTDYHVDKNGTIVFITPQQLRLEEIVNRHGLRIELGIGVEGQKRRKRISISHPGLNPQNHFVFEYIDHNAGDGSGYCMFCHGQPDGSRGQSNLKPTKNADRMMNNQLCTPKDDRLMQSCGKRAKVGDQYSGFKKPSAFGKEYRQTGHGMGNKGETFEGMFEHVQAETFKTRKLAGKPGSMINSDGNGQSEAGFEPSQQLAYPEEALNACWRFNNVKVSEENNSWSEDHQSLNDHVNPFKLEGSCETQDCQSPSSIVQIGKASEQQEIERECSQKSVLQKCHVSQHDLKINLTQESMAGQSFDRIEDFETCSRQPMRSSSMNKDQLDGSVNNLDDVPLESCKFPMATMTATMIENSSLNEDDIWRLLNEHRDTMGQPNQQADDPHLKTRNPSLNASNYKPIGEVKEVHKAMLSINKVGATTNRLSNSTFDMNWGENKEGNIAQVTFGANHEKEGPAPALSSLYFAIEELYELMDFTNDVDHACSG